MAKKCFYKADPHLRSWSNKVITDFRDGYYTSKNRYGEVVKRKIDPVRPGQAGKVNNFLYSQAMENSRSYSRLISIELTCLNLVRSYLDNSYGITSNLRRILDAQMGTNNVMKSLMYALRRYPVKAKELYEEIKKDLDSTQERYERNRIFLDTFLDECGLTPLVEAVNAKTGENMYDFAERVTAEAMDELGSLSDFSDEQVYEEKTAYLTLKLQEIAKENGLDIEAMILAANEKKTAHRKEIQQAIRERKKESRENQKRLDAANAFARDSANVVSALDCANKNQKLSRFAYNAVLNHVSFYGGRAFYLAVFNITKIMYVKADGSLTSSLGSAGWFASKSCEEYKQTYATVKKQFPHAVIDGVEIILPDILVKNHQAHVSMSDSSVESARKRDVYRFISIIENYGNCNADVAFRIEELLMRSGKNSFYYIYALNKETAEEYHLAEDGEFTYSMVRTACFLLEEDAVAMMTACREKCKELGYDLYVNYVPYNKKAYHCHEHVKECVEKHVKNAQEEMNESHSYRSSYRGSWYTPLQYFSSFSAKKLYKTTVDETETIYVLWRAHVSPVSVSVTIPSLAQCGKRDRLVPFSEFIEKYSHEELAEKLRYESPFKSSNCILVSNLDEKEKLDNFVSFLRDEMDDHLNKMYGLIQISKNEEKYEMKVL